jgi:hypothetical protein
MAIASRPLLVGQDGARRKGDLPVGAIGNLSADDWTAFRTPKLICAAGNMDTVGAVPTC